jgi:glycosyltransferase involved in cell wall biosynthesis
VRIDQWVPALHSGDAIGDSARLMRDVLRRWGFTADVYALDVDPDLAGDGRPFTEWTAGGPEDVVLLHYALPSPLTDALREQRGPRLLLHHNITPPEFFAGWDPELVRICGEGRRQLARLVGHVELALGDSEFNRRELVEAGFARTGVLPILLDFARYREAPNPVLLRQLGDGRTNALFVGRVAPNKRHEDLIRLASYWRRFIDPNLRLLLVGRLPRRRTGHGDPLPRHYFDALQSFLYEEGFRPEQVTFTGHLAHRDLLACYASARLFLSMSEHEGFAVPLVEAMLMDVPVLAYAAGAVPDTLGGAGVLFREKRFDLVAETAFELAHDAALRQAVLAEQRRRLEAFGPPAVEAALRRHLESIGVRR